MANICEKCTHRIVCRYKEPCEECNQFAEEVVRCKDCKCAYINSFSAASGVAVCKKWSNEAETAIVQQDDFCSYGERREGE